MIRCILACDLKGGLVVRGIKGDRDHYRPIGETSLVTKSSMPVEVIRAMRPLETYIADLDRIMGKGSNLAIIKELSGMTLTMADTGISDKQGIESTKLVARSVVIGTETAPLSLIKEYGNRDILLSLDMKGGKTMAVDPALRLSPLHALKALNDIELGAVILLDIGRVGSMGGVETGFIEDAVAASRHDIIVGGGVRDMEDLDTIEKAGAKGVIIASAVHDGKVPLSVLRGA